MLYSVTRHALSSTRVNEDVLEMWERWRSKEVFFISLLFVLFCFCSFGVLVFIFVCLLVLVQFSLILLKIFNLRPAVGQRKRYGGTGR